jgi:putative nucleotidyltransferase with HDIG domain
VQEAAVGALITEQTALSANQNIRQQHLPEVLEVYIPIRHDDQVIGVAEVYRDISAQVAESRRIALLASAAVCAGSLLLFFSLLGIFRDSTRRLRRQSDALAASVGELQQTHSATLEALVTALDARDHETEGHSERVTRYATAIGSALGLESASLAALEHGALLHDIGKIGVPDNVLRKPGPLDADEWALMRRHPAFGAEMVGGISFLSQATPVVRHHHERYDGGGYPDRLAGAEIPLVARVFAVADTFDAMTSDRPYRPALTIEAARAEIERCAAVQFDPVVVEAFLSLSEGELASIQEASRAGRLMRARLQDLLIQAPASAPAPEPVAASVG